MDAQQTPLDLLNEEHRLQTLNALGILDTPPEDVFDNLTALAATALGAQSAAISLVDGHRQWFKARCGVPFSETPREHAFCAHALQHDRLLVVPDAAQDPRFRENPYVRADGGIRFYAGAPLVMASGHILGTLCVFDPAPRKGLEPPQAHVLRDLARLATDLIASREIRRQSEIAAQVVEATSDAVLAADERGAIVFWNLGAERIFGRAAHEAIGQKLDIILPARFRARQLRVLALAAGGPAAASQGVSAVELTALHADGREFPIELSLAPWRERGETRGVAGIVRDITDRKSLEHQRAYAHAFLDTVIDNLPGMLFVKDVDTRRYVKVNRAGQALIGRPLDAVLGATDCELFPRFGDAYERRDSEAILASEPTVFESQFVRDDGDVRHLRTTRTVINGPDRERQYVLGVSEDVTAIRAAESAALHLAHYDSLTGLLNRASYAERLQALVRAGRPFALLSIDLDRFKAVNDQFGHLAGDAVLTAVGERLRATVGESDWIARIGGDEFVAVLEGEDLRRRAQQVAETMINRLAEPFTARRSIAHCGASIGVVLAPQDGRSSARLRENVDLALYRAKESGKGKACFFNAEMDAAARDRRALESDLRAAVEAGELTVAYQPVVSAITGLITSAEALARWTHPQLGAVSPDLFIPIAEECGLIDALSAQLINQACAAAMSWPDYIRVAVNLSPQQFVAGRLLETIQSALETSGLAASRLQVEVTEGLLIRDVERTFHQLAALRRLGIQILMDDFGVGYSSLAYFERFPFDKVKIDKSFIDQVTTSKTAKAIVQAVIGLGSDLGMGVVAEGVETPGQMTLLRDWGCTHFQGYLLSRPVEARHIPALARVRLPAEVVIDQRRAGQA